MNKKFEGKTPEEMRTLFHSNGLVVPTAGICPGYVQANLVIVPGDCADEYLKFLKQNQKPCPILEVIRGTEPISKLIAPGADITKDFPLYNVYIDGKLSRTEKSIEKLWTSDMMAVLIGCSLTFEEKLVKHGIEISNYKYNKRVPMYDTNIPCKPIGNFSGNYVVSMRPIPRDKVDIAIKITSDMPYAHGAPVHLGSPQEIGIADIMRPDYGDPPEIDEGTVPVFWACGVTAQSVAIRCGPGIVIAHAPGYMLITDININDADALKNF